MADSSPSKSRVLPEITQNASHNLSNKNLQQHFTSIGSTSSRTHDRAYSLDSSAGDSDGAPSISLHGARYVNHEVALSSRQLQQLFPYHISVDKDFNVVQMGEKLYPLVRCILSPNSNKKRINQHISKYFKIVSPASMINNWDVKMLSNLHVYSPATSGLIEVELVGPRSPMGLSAPRYAEDTLQAQAQRLVLKGRFHELDAFSAGGLHAPHSSSHAIHEDEDGSEGSGKGVGADGPGGVYLFILYPSNHQGGPSGEDWSSSPFAHISAASEKVSRRHTSDSVTSEIARLMAENAALLAENERLKEEATGKNMRGMIGNVAHDLKTPLAAFMGGVELINDMARDCELLLASSEQHLAGTTSRPTSGPTTGPGSSSSKLSTAATAGNGSGSGSGTAGSEGRQMSRLLGSLRTSLKGIAQQAVGVRDINQFMTMTINRCIDYTKASQGVKLVPRNETVNLTEVLAMPINCMIASQSKVAFRLHNPPLDICTHVITDKIWLQENMLCLLSNAAKYSNAGRVDIKISLFPAQCLDEAADRAASVLSASTPTTGSHKTDARPPTENICGPLSAKQVMVIHNQRQERSLAASSSPAHPGHSLSSSSKDSRHGGSHKRSGSIGPTSSPLSPSTTTRRSTQVPLSGGSSSKVLSPVQHYRSTISGGIDVSAQAEAAARHALGINIPPHNPSGHASPIAGSKEEHNYINNTNNNNGVSSSRTNADGSPRVTSSRMYSRPRAGTSTDPLLQPPKEQDDYVNSPGTSTPKSTAALSPIAHPNAFNGNMMSNGHTNGHTNGHHSGAYAGAHALGHGRAAPSPTNSHHHGGMISTAIGNAMGLIKGTTGKFKSGSSPSHSRGVSQSNSQAQSRAHSRSQSADVNENASLAGSVSSTSHALPLGKVRLSRADKIRHSVRGSEYEDTDSMQNAASIHQDDIEAMAMRGSFSDDDNDGEMDRASVYSDYSSRQVSTDSRQYSTDSRQNFKLSRGDADLLMRSFDEEHHEEESAKTISQHHLMYSGSNASLSYSPSSYSYLASNNLLPATPVEVFPQPSGGLFNRPIQKLNTSNNNSNGGSNSGSVHDHKDLASRDKERDSCRPHGLERPSHLAAPSPSPTHLHHHHTHSTAAALLPLLLVEIEDTGIGLSESNMNKLYSPFMQAQRLAGGTGLGLYSLSKRLDALGGHYGVECRKDGAPGSLFWFAIPYREDADAASSSSAPGKMQRQNSSRLEDLIMSIQPALKSMGLLDSNSNTSSTSNGNGNTESLGVDRMGTISEQDGHGSAKSIADPEPQNESAPHSLHCSSNSSSSLRTSTGSVPAFHPSAHLMHSTTQSYNSISQSQGHNQDQGTGTGQGSPTSHNTPNVTSSPVLPASVGVGGSRPMHFLLVDDSESILKVTSMLLTRSGHTVERAENGVIALDKIAASHVPGGRAFDVVLMDLLMPVLDGLEATRRLRELEQEQLETLTQAHNSSYSSSQKGLKLPSELPKRQVVIGLSANGDEETANEAYSAGVDRFIEKPFSLQKLLEALQEIHCEE